MTPAAALLVDLRRRRIRLALAADGLRYEAPRGAFTAADREAVSAHRREIVELLRAAAEDPVPNRPCGLCGGVLAWVEHWPTAGDARWLCPRCASFPSPTLAAVFAQLTPQERERLKAEGAQGDGLARAVLSELRGEAECV